MGRRFADEVSLDNPSDVGAIRDYWYPIHFISKLNEGDAAASFVLFGERWELVADDDAAVAAANTAVGVFGPEYAETQAHLVDGAAQRWTCRSRDDATRFLPIGLQDGLVMVWPGTCKARSI